MTTTKKCLFFIQLIDEDDCELPLSTNIFFFKGTFNKHIESPKKDGIFIKRWYIYKDQKHI